MKQLNGTAERFLQIEDVETHLRYLETEAKLLVEALDQKEKLVNALYEAREQITSLKEEVDKLCAPPSTYGVYLSVTRMARSTSSRRGAR